MGNVKAKTPSGPTRLGYQLATTGKAPGYVTGSNVGGKASTTKPFSKGGKAKK